MKPSERRILKTSAICHYLDLSIFLAKKLVFFDHFDGKNKLL